MPSHSGWSLSKQGQGELCVQCTVGVFMLTESPAAHDAAEALFLQAPCHTSVSLTVQFWCERHEVVFFPMHLSSQTLVHVCVLLMLGSSSISAEDAAAHTVCIVI